jgi:hypothetical protein
MGAGGTLEGDLTLDKLVLELREAIIEFLPPGADRIRLAGTCVALRDAVGRVDRKAERLAPLTPHTRVSLEGLGPWLARFGGLRSLALVGCASDSVLAAVAAAAPALPFLFELDVSQSVALTDQGLAALARRLPGSLATDPAAPVRPWPRLGHVNVAFCDGTTFGGSLLLRGAFAAPPLVVQRLPAWLQGCFETPWGETHVYFADGSFTFDRSNQAVGFVRWLRQQPPAKRSGGAARSDADADADAGWIGSLAERFFLADSLQYIDFEPPPGWPPWARFVYRPGVALCPRPPLSLPPPPPPAAGARGAPRAAPRATRHVLVAQLLKGLRAPRVLPDVPIDAVPVGGRVFARANGELGPAGMSEDGAALNYDVMISCMPVAPLWTLPAGLAHAVEGGEGPAELAWRWLMPPPELVARIAAFERAREALPFDEARLEDVIDAALSGPQQEDEDEDEAEEAAAAGDAPLLPSGAAVAADGGAAAESRVGMIAPELAGEAARRSAGREPWELAERDAR